LAHQDDIAMLGRQEHWWMVKKEKFFRNIGGVA
jgi:hypothetical protein